MKHWKLFPILVKIEVLKNMNLSDRLSFSKCSKKCWNLLSRIPSHLTILKIPYDHRFSVDDFLTLLTCRKSTIQKLIVEIETARQRDQVNKFLSKLYKVRNSVQVKKIIMEIRLKYSEMYKKCIDLCDPSFIESIEIERLGAQEVYEDVLKTPQWKNSQEVSLNWKCDSNLKVNIDDFLHFKSFSLKVEELSVDEAWKLVQNTFSIGSPGDYIHVKSQKRGVQGDLIREKIETELAGDWKDVGILGWRYLRHPENPNKVLEYMGRLNAFHVEFLTLDEFKSKRSLNPIWR